MLVQNVSLTSDARCRVMKYVTQARTHCAVLFCNPAPNNGSYSAACGSEGSLRSGYFVPGRDGTRAWQISGVVRVTARAFLLFY